MKRFLWMTPIVLTAGLALAGCKDASDRPSTSAPVAADGVKMSDADLEKAIKSKLEADEQTRQANLSVDAEVKDNKVSIKGTVPTQDVRAKAIELVKSVQPGLTINDEIEVKPAG